MVIILGLTSILGCKHSVFVLNTHRHVDLNLGLIGFIHIIRSSKDPDLTYPSLYLAKQNGPDLVKPLRHKTRQTHQAHGAVVLSGGQDMDHSLDLINHRSFC